MDRLSDERILEIVRSVADHCVLSHGDKEPFSDEQWDGFMSQDDGIGRDLILGMCRAIESERPEAIPAPVVSDDFVLVPRELTPPMLDQFIKLIDGPDRSPQEHWEYMLRAATAKTNEAGSTSDAAGVS